MLERAKKELERTKVGSAGAFGPGVPGLAALEAFQAVEAYADELHKQGIIQVHRKRREDYTGRQLLDEISFKRLA